MLVRYVQRRMSQMQKMEVRETGMLMANQPSHDMGGFMYSCVGMCLRKDAQISKDWELGTNEGDEVLRRRDRGCHAANVGREGDAEDQGFGKGGSRGKSAKDRLKTRKCEPTLNKKREKHEGGPG